MAPAEEGDQHDDADGQGEGEEADGLASAPGGEEPQPELGGDLGPGGTGWGALPGLAIGRKNREQSPIGRVP